MNKMSCRDFFDIENMIATPVYGYFTDIIDSYLKFTLLQGVYENTPK